MKMKARRRRPQGSLATVRLQALNRRLSTEALQRASQLTQLTHHLQTAREDERARLARDLHDELGSLLTSAKLDAARLRSRLVAAMAAAAPVAEDSLERLTHLTSTLDSVIALKRRITEDLRPSSLDHLGLAVTLQILGREFGARAGVDMHLALTAAPLSAAAETVAYRIAQEAVTNISKYAQASAVWISLARHGDNVRLTVRDNGVGFDTAAPRTRRYGLVGMGFRAEAERGRLRVHSKPGHGTSVVLTLPVSGPAVAQARQEGTGMKG
jgi:signal transduction histidine kinase